MIRKRGDNIGISMRNMSAAVEKTSVGKRGKRTCGGRLEELEARSLDGDRQQRNNK